MKYFHFCLVLIPFFLGCSNDDKIKPIENHNYLKDADIKSIASALTYACKPKPLDKTTDPAENTLVQNCNASDIPKSEFKVTMSWYCPQSDGAKYNRPIPSTKEIEIPATVTMADNKIDVHFDLQTIRNFFESVNKGNTSYTECLKNFDLYESYSVFSKISVGSCSINELVKKTYTSNLKDYIDILIADSSQREKKEILLPPIMPFFEQIDGVDLPESVSSCESDLYSTYSADNTKVASYSSVALYTLSKKYIESKLKNNYEGNPSCALKTLRLLAPEDHISSGCLNTQKNQNCKVQIDNYKKVLSTLDGIFNKTKDQKLDVLFAESKGSLSAFVRKYDDWLDSLPRTENALCGSLAVGESKIIHKKDSKQIYGNYKVTRISSEKSEIEINVVFKPDCDSTEFENKKISDLWFQHVNQCLDMVAPFMKAPDGQLIGLKLVSKSDLETSEANIISVLPYEQHIRENSGHYSILSSCATILHEVLHLTGLVDEYHERDISTPYMCRAEGPPDSIMSNTEAAYENTSRVGVSLLKPAHARFLLHPNCEKENGVYNKCAEFAYSNSCDMNDRPVECKNNSLDWILK